MSTQTAIAKVLVGFEVGVFVRNIDGDGESGWALKALPYIAALAELSHEIAPRIPSNEVELSRGVRGPGGEPPSE